MIIMALIWVSLWLFYIEKRKDQKVYIIAHVDVFHHKVDAPETGSLEIVQEKPNPVVSKKETIEKPTVVATIDKATPPKPIDPTKRIIKKEWHVDDERQDFINYAYQKWWQDFLLTIEGENGLWKWDRKSMIVWKNWYSDYGICQLNAQYHSKFIFANGSNLKAGFSEDFKDTYKQIDYCFWVWQDAINKNRLKTTFYAYNSRGAKAVRFENL